jgi:hypothetical protein
VRPSVVDPPRTGCFEQLFAAARGVPDDQAPGGERLRDRKPETFRDPERDEDGGSAQCLDDLVLGQLSEDGQVDAGRSRVVAQQSLQY